MDYIITYDNQYLQRKNSIILTSSGKHDLPVSAGVEAPAEMPRSGNEVMSK
jgi:hypothetical protein